MNDKNPKDLILEALINHPEGLTMVSLAEVVGLHRHTTTKYLYELIGADLVYQRKVGSARLCYYKERTEENGKEITPLEIRGNKVPGDKSQIRFIAIFLLLGIILISSSVIASNFLNGTSNETPTGQLVLNSIKDTKTQEILPPETTDVEIISNDSTTRNFSNTSFTDDRTSEIIDTSKSTIINETSPTEITEPPNASETPVNNNETSETSEINNTNVSKDINSTNPIEISPIEVQKPILNVNIEHQEKVTRGDKITIKAKIENTGSFVAKNVVCSWILPKGFEIISKEDDCRNLEQNTSCTSVITVQTSSSVDVGLEEIKIVVNYGT
jgi:uncharacterized repeat protein (TIGR01451 family)